MMGYRLWGLKYRSSIAIVVYLHVVLWGSLIALIIALDLLSSAYVDMTLRPNAVLYLLSSLLALGYIVFHHINARQRKMMYSDEERSQSIKRPTYIAVRMAVTVAMAWLITAGWSLIIAARQPICLPRVSILPYWQAGGPCVAQRFGTFVSMLVLISSCSLFASIASSSDPFESHLFGKIKDAPTPAIEAPPQMFPFQLQFPIPMPPQYEKRGRSHKRSHSDSSMTSDKSMPETMDISSRPLSPVSPSPVGLGVFTPVDFPVEPPMSGLNSRATSRPTSRPGTAHSSMRRPFTSYSTTSLVNHPYQHHRRNHSTTSLPGFTPMMPIVRPPPAITADSAWKALHPPAHQFRHFSSAYGPIVRPGMTAAFSTIRAIPQSPSLGLGSRTPSVHSGSVYYSYSRNRSTGFVPMPPTRDSSKSSSSESGTILRSRMKHMRSASDPNDIQFPQRGADMDLAIRLEQKLAEVKARLERQKSQSTASESDDFNSNTSANTDISGLVSQGPSKLSALRKSRSAVDLITPSSLWLKHGHRRISSSYFDRGEVKGDQLRFHAF